MRFQSSILAGHTHTSNSHTFSTFKQSCTARELQAECCALSIRTLMDSGEHTCTYPLVDKCYPSDVRHHPPVNPTSLASCQPALFQSPFLRFLIPYHCTFRAPPTAVCSSSLVCPSSLRFSIYSSKHILQHQCFYYLTLRPSFLPRLLLFWLPRCASWMNSSSTTIL